MTVDIDVTKLPWWKNTLELGNQINAAIASTPDANPHTVAMAVIAGFVFSNVSEALSLCEEHGYEAGMLLDVLTSNAHPNAKPRHDGYIVPGQVGHA